MDPKINKPSLPYQLYLHNEEMRNPKSKVLRRIKSKMQLTSQLINHNIERLDEFSAQDMMALKRQMNFKDELKFTADLINEIREETKHDIVPSTWL